MKNAVMQYIFSIVSLYELVLIGTIAELYMIIGGIPFYMNYVEKGMSSEQIIDTMFFETNAPLKNEFDNLYMALFKNPNHHLRIIESLSK